METTKHTPGPWRIGDAGHTVFGPKTTEPAPVTVAARLDATPRVSLEERKANLHLIAAAPDLLAACDGALAALTQTQTFPTDIKVAKRILKDAIAKAKGQA